jgi:hypothetical protein
MSGAPTKSEGNPCMTSMPLPDFANAHPGYGLRRAPPLRPLDLRLEFLQRIGRVDIDQRRAPGGRHFGDRFRVARDQVPGADIAAERGEFGEEAARPHHRVAALAVHGRHHHQRAVFLATAAVSYDALNRPLSFTFGSVPAQTAPAASSSAFSYVYNSMNQTINQTATDNSWWFYPTMASTLRYSANGLSQYTAVGTVTPTYDGNGNLTFDGTFTYGYDAESRLTSVAQSGAPIATYRNYSPLCDGMTRV